MKCQNRTKKIAAAIRYEDRAAHRARPVRTRYTRPRLESSVRCEWRRGSKSAQNRMDSMRPFRPG